MTLAKEIIRYLETLEIGQGRHAGKPFKVLPWQGRFLRGAFHPKAKGDAGLSMGRGNGKSSFVSGLACAFLDGPLSEPMAECLIVASSFDQGKQACFRHILHFLKPEFEKGGTGPNGLWRIQDSSNRASIENRETGALVRVMGSNPKRLHGAVPKLALLDELAQWDANKIDSSLAALKTARGKIRGSKGLWIGTRPDFEDHPFERFLTGGSGYRQVYAVDKEIDSKKLFWKQTYTRANPSLSHMPDLLEAIQEEAIDARKDPAELASFKALRLNMGVSDTIQTVLLPAEEWAKVESSKNEGRTGPYILGIDPGSGTSMTAASGYWVETGRLEAFACVGGIPNLQVRGDSDGVGPLYLRMASRGELVVTPTRVPDLEDLLIEVKTRWGYPAAIVVDRWREKELKDALEAVRFPLCPFVVRGMGFKDGAEDLRLFKKAVFRGRVTPQESLLLRAGMRDARAVSDPAGNKKLAKQSQGGRRWMAKDDCVAASMLAVAEGMRRYKITPADSGAMSCLI